VPRHPALRLAAPAGALLAALCGVPGWAQTAAPPSGLRLTFDENGQELPRPGVVKPPRRPAPQPAGVLPTFGTPPGAGAGQTGFISTNVTRRSRTPARPGTRATPNGRDGAPVRPAAKPPPPLPPVAPPVTARSAARPARAPVAAVPPRSAAPGTSPPGTAVGTATGTTTPAAAAAGSAPATNAAAVLPVVVPQRPRLPPPEDDPFGPVGIRAGAFELRPAIEAMTGYDTNPARLTAAARGSRQFTIAPELLARSDWERHQLDVALRGSYNYYPEVPLADRPNVDARVNARIDVTRDTRVDLETRYLLSTDYPGSPNLTAGLARMPIYTDAGATAGVGERFNRFDVALKGSFDRIVWQESLLTDGTTSGNTDRNYNQYGLQLRGGYELTPGVKPFIEVNADTRIHDLAVDRTGADRDSNGLATKVGTAFELTRTLTGEISVGYLTRLYDDPNLLNIHAPLLDASLLWAATGLTNIKFAAKTTVDESVLPGVSGVLRHDNGLEISHALRRWLITTVKFGYGTDDYVGSFRHDRRYLASLGLTYKLSRDLWLKSELRQEWLISNIPLSNYAATIALIGLRLQR
jgi:hypothetical protein